MDLYSARLGNFVIAVNWNKTRKQSSNRNIESHLFDVVIVQYIRIYVRITYSIDLFIIEGK